MNDIVSAGWWFVVCFLTGAVGTAVLLAIGNSDGRSRFGRWWAGTPKAATGGSTPEPDSATAQSAPSPTRSDAGE